eukprot:CAMPEP_0182466620 /NCGR_PEP_ID=MMETSP1319-20130603/12396_1 /TAXON_ID=172717 /ORGANISM="Bolidomonas pacifica, Strain RCC208" /LENGTH=101 /DNA_ID=CAMNT_0024666633 /DNA_START=320 /DNA_END=622 /DNA_ORIENTATION=+
MKLNDVQAILQAIKASLDLINTDPKPSPGPMSPSKTINILHLFAHPNTSSAVGGVSSLSFLSSSLALRSCAMSFSLSRLFSFSRSLILGRNYLLRVHAVIR